ncbi:nitroreductase family protein [Polymorphospora rubra]|uniref:nitroreductase family protein n=1 Tax=Polymorphospora rubra TaxID=338584 RepID=UPI0033C4BBE3
MTSPAGLALALLRSFDAAGPPGDPLPALPPLPAVGPPVAVPVADRPPTDPLTTLSRRRAVRQFAATPLRLPELGAAVAAGIAADRRDRPTEVDHDRLEVLVVALRVDGLATGVHRYDAVARTVTPVLPLPDRDAGAHLTAGREFAAAGAIVTVLGDIGSAVARRGAHGYRQLLTRAGAAAYAMWLDAVARDLTGCVFAGLVPAAVRRPLRCDGVRRQPLSAVALGNPHSHRVSANPSGRSPGVPPGPGRPGPISREAVRKFMNPVELDLYAEDLAESRYGAGNG